MVSHPVSMLNHRTIYFSYMSQNLLKILERSQFFATLEQRSLSNEESLLMNETAYIVASHIWKMILCS